MNFRIERTYNQKNIKRNILKLQNLDERITGTNGSIQITTENFNNMIKDMYLNTNSDGTGTYLYGLDITEDTKTEGKFVFPVFDGVSLNEGSEYYNYMFTLLVQQKIDPRKISASTEFSILHTKIQFMYNSRYD